MASRVLLVLAACAHSAFTPGAASRRQPPTPGSLPGDLMTPEQLEQLRAVPLRTLPEHTGGHFDCKVREYAYEYAQSLQAWRGATKMREIFDSLQLTTLCNGTFDATRFGATPRAHTHEHLSDGGSLKAFVDAFGSTTRRGAALNDASAPFSTVHDAVAALRAVRRSSRQRATVVLREGTHYMTSTLELGPQDSHMSFVNYPGEAASMSGAMPLATDWRPYRPPASVKRQAAADIWVCDLSAQNVRALPGLRVDGARSGRASFPNRQPETSIFPDGWIADKTALWAPPLPPKKNETHVTVASPMLRDKTMFQQYMVGIGGHCERYTPPVSYWCGASPKGGCFGGCFQSFPSALTYSKLKDWKNPSKGIVTAWRPNHWANWMFEIDAWDPVTKTIGWTKGGFQGARGNTVGAEFFIENVFEELDSENEYFFDEDSQLLYYVPNRTQTTLGSNSSGGGASNRSRSSSGSGGGPPQGKFEAVINKTIVKLYGSAAHPVEDVRFEGITFRDAAYTYMEPHGVPSGGDWGLQRMGAIHLEGTRNVAIEHCLVTRVDGNAIMLSGYNRNTSILRNEFVWIGDSVIASWGDTAPLGGDANDTILASYRGAGIDGTGGEQPRGTVASENLVHEIGHFEKQSSGWFQAKSCQNIIKRNIMFNMPRAAIVFNDGFGGGSVVTENLGYNSCRESSDHAVFNSWDRQPFLTEVGQKAPAPDLNPSYNLIARNFFIGNYGASLAIDNDDGSSFYKITSNFEVYGGHKSNFGGHNKLRSGALIPYAKVYREGLCVSVNAQSVTAEFADGFFNNTCIQSGRNLTAYSFTYCDPLKPNNATNLGWLHDNTIYNPDGKMTVECGKSGMGTKGPPRQGRVFTEAEFQASGADPGSSARVTPPDDVIIGWARAMLEPLRPP